MAKHAKHDGRFGTEFDDEISSGGVWASILLVFGSMVFAFFAMALLLKWFEGRQDTPTIAATPRLVAEAAKVAAPPSTRLQADPEGELVELRREMAKRLHGYGWVDQSGGTVHIPIEDAMALVLERGLPAAKVLPVAPLEGDGAAEDAAVDPAGGAISDEAYDS